MQKKNCQLNKKIKKKLLEFLRNIFQSKGLVECYHLTVRHL